MAAPLLGAERGMRPAKVIGHNYSLGRLLEFQQVVPEVFVSVLRSCQSAALQFRYQPVAHFHDIAPVESGIEEQETVASDLFHDLLHQAGDVVDRPGEIDAGFGGLADGYLPTRLADSSG